MRKIAWIGLASLLLCACTEATSDALPAEPADQVLQKASVTSRSLQSARYDMVIDYGYQTPGLASEGSFAIDGTLQEAGSIVHFLLDGSANMSVDTQTYDAQLKLEGKVFSQDEIYLLFHTLSVTPANALISDVVSQDILNQWLQLPTQNTPQPTTVTPDPRLLRAQTELLQVTKELGVETINERQAYHYQVTIDPNKLVDYLKQTTPESEFDAQAIEAMLQTVSWQGEVWIDTELYYVHMIRWNIRTETTDESDTNFDVIFTMNLTDHNQAPPVLPPSDPRPFFPSPLASDSQSAFDDIPSDTNPDLIDQLFESSLVLPPS